MVRGWGLLVGLALVGAALAQGPGPEGADGAVVVNRLNRVYHRPDCVVLKRTAAKYKAELPGPGAAAAQGFKPCTTCKPPVAEPPATKDENEGDASQPAVPASAATKGDVLKFSRDIAPLLVAHCVGCHNPRDKVRRKSLDLSSFQAITAGGIDGPIIAPGKPDESNLVLRLRGELTPKMPPNRDLAPEAIARFERWVREGARLDPRIDPAAELATYAPSAEERRRDELASLGVGERDKQAEEAGRQRWAKGSSETPEATFSPHFVLLGRLPAARAQSLLKALESQHVALRGLLGGAPPAAARAAAKGQAPPAPAGPAILNGPEKIGVYVFNDTSALVEFARAVEGRELEAGTQAGHNLRVESPYLVAVDPLGGAAEPTAGASNKKGRSRREADFTGPERTLAGLLVEQLGEGVAMNAGGSPPRWLCLGLGAFLSAQVDGRSPYYSRLRSEVAGFYRQGWVTRSQEVLGNQGDASQTRAIGFSMLEWLAAAAPRAFLPFVRAMMQDGTKLDEVLQNGLGVTREQFLNNWGAFVAQRYGRGR